MKKPLIALVIMPVIILVVLVAGYGVSRWNYYYGSCGVLRVNAALQKFNQVGKIISHGFDLFDKGEAVDMTGPINEMQSAKREAALIEVPACMNKSKSLIVEGIQKYIDAYSALDSQKEFIVVLDMLRNATEQMRVADDEVKAVLACAPYCPPDHYNTTP